jgi:hypothetical protein
MIPLLDLLGLQENSLDQRIHHPAVSTYSFQIAAVVTENETTNNWLKKKCQKHRLIKKKLDLKPWFHKTMPHH